MTTTLHMRYRQGMTLTRTSRSGQDAHAPHACVLAGVVVASGSMVDVSVCKHPGTTLWWTHQVERTQTMSEHMIKPQITQEQIRIRQELLALPKLAEGCSWATGWNWLGKVVDATQDARLMLAYQACEIELLLDGDAWMSGPAYGRAIRFMFPQVQAVVAELGLRLGQGGWHNDTGVWLADSAELV